MKIRKANKEDNKKCLEIAKALPEWFDEKGIKKISKDLIELESFVYEDVDIMGYICIREKSDRVVEIAQLGVQRDKQRIGIGTALLNYIEHNILDNRILEVKTLDESCDYKPYIKTRAFYNKNGFIKIEVIDSYPGWEPGNPCAIYIKTPQT